MHYHFIPGPENWRDENPAIDEAVEQSIIKYRYALQPFGEYRNDMDRHMSAARILERRGLISEGALKKYGALFKLVVEHEGGQKQYDGQRDRSI